TKRIGLTLKILLLVFLPVPLVLWPVFAIVGSFLVGLGYGFFTPLIETFEASGENISVKLYHYFLDGCLSTLKESCTTVRDFTDFCFHSYFSFMDELIEKNHEDDEPMDIKYVCSQALTVGVHKIKMRSYVLIPCVPLARLLMVPSCLLVSILAVPVDVVLITAVAFCKSPSMLLKGWKRLSEDLIGREGPFLETVCVPFAGLAILLWPIAVVAAVVASFLCSFSLGLYSGVIVHQENSLKMGLAFIISVVSLFDEYTNDLLFLREGSCLPRPRYRRNMLPLPEPLERSKSIGNECNDQTNVDVRMDPQGSRLVSEGSKTLKWAIKQLKPMQVWDWLFRSCEVNGRKLLRDGLIDIKDIEECIVKGKCHKLGIKLPAWCILQCLLASAKSDSTGLLLSDEEELGRVNWPKDKVLEWLVGPLLIMKEQIRGLHLNESEEACLRNLIISYNNESPEDWNDTEFPSDDNVKRAQLQAIFRRLQGIVASMTRMPTFRRRFQNLVKVLYIEAIESGGDGQEGNSKSKTSMKIASLGSQTSSTSDNVGGSMLADNVGEAGNGIQDNSENV
ncbi:Steroid nuclear receptor ligand-binding, partial [Thalictrum thalictroides]